VTPYKGRLTYVANSNSSGTVSATMFNWFDPMGRVTSSTQSTGGTTYKSFAYTYNLAGALATETYPSGTSVSNLYDAAGRVISVQGGSATATVNAYDPTGPILSLTLGNGVTENWTLGTPQKQPTALAVAMSGSSLLSLGWGYGTGLTPSLTNNGNVTSASIVTGATV
jgi:YD repeat-containing protein